MCIFPCNLCYGYVIIKSSESVFYNSIKISVQKYLRDSTYDIAPEPFMCAHRVEAEMPPPSVVEKEKCTLCGEL